MQGDKFVLVAMNLFSKYVKLYPMPNIKLDTIMERLKNGLFQEIGVPKTILTDNGTQFSVDRWQQFANKHGFEVRRTTLCNPQSNPVERVMRELGRILRTYASYRHHTWNRILKRAEEVINDTTHSSTHSSHRVN